MSRMGEIFKICCKSERIDHKNSVPRKRFARRCATQKKINDPKVIASQTPDGRSATFRVQGLGLIFLFLFSLFFLLVFELFLNFF